MLLGGSRVGLERYNHLEENVHEIDYFEVALFCSENLQPTLGFGGGIHFGQTEGAESLYYFVHEADEVSEVGIVDAKTHDDSGEMVEMVFSVCVLEEIAEELSGLLGNEDGGVDGLLRIFGKAILQVGVHQRVDAFVEVVDSDVFDDGDQVLQQFFLLEDRFALQKQDQHLQAALSFLPLLHAPVQLPRHCCVYS